MPHYPLNKYLISDCEDNILNIKMEYNESLKVFLIFIPHNKLILYKPYFMPLMVIDNFLLKNQDFSNAIIYFHESEIFITNLVVENSLPTFRLLQIDFDLGKKKVYVKHNKFPLIRKHNYEIGLSNLFFYDQRGFFLKNSYKTIQDYIFLKRDKKDESLICFILVNSRLNCYKLYPNDRFLDFNSMEVFQSSLVASFFILILILFTTKMVFLLKNYVWGILLKKRKIRERKQRKLS